MYDYHPDKVILGKCDLKVRNNVSIAEVKKQIAYNFWNRKGKKKRSDNHMYIVRFIRICRYVYNRVAAIGKPVAALPPVFLRKNRKKVS